MANKYKKFVATAATATLVASAIVPVASANEVKFVDVKDSSEYAPYIYDLAGQQIMTGNGENFNPGKEVTRTAAVKTLGKLLVNVHGYEVPADYKTVARFNDVAVDAKDQELVKYAALLKDLGIFTGNEAGNLNAAGTLNREQMAKVVVEAYSVIEGVEIVELVADFESALTDLASVSASNVDYVKVFEKYGITTVDTFNPKGKIQRQHFAKFLSLAIGSEALATDTAELAGKVEDKVTPALEAVETAVAALPKVEEITVETAEAATTAVDAVTAAVEAATKVITAAELSAEDKTAAEAKLAAATAAAKTVADKVAEVTVVFEISSITAINETSIEVSFDKDAKVTEADLVDATLSLVAGKTTLTAEYSEKSLDKEGKATFTLKTGEKLVDTTEYTVTGKAVTETKFVAKVGGAKIAKFTKVTEAVPATTNEKGEDSKLATIKFAGLDQYGEDIVVPSTDVTVTGTVNGMPLLEDELELTTADTVKVKKSLKKGDVVALTFVAKANDKEIAKSTLSYEVVEFAETVASSIELSTVENKTSVPSGESIEFEAKVLDQFKTPKTADIRWVVNGVAKTTTDSTFELTEKTPGEYKVKAFLANNSKVVAEKTVTIGAAKLTDVKFDATVTNVEDVKVTADRYNNEELVLGTITPNEGAALVASNVNFNVTTTSSSLKAEDIKVIAEEMTNKDGKKVIVVKAKTTKAGTFQVTPFVGDQFTAEKTVKGTAFAVVTKTNPEVAAMSNVVFSAAELKVGQDIYKEIVLTNKHGEVLTASEAAVKATSSNQNVVNDDAVEVVQGNKAIAGQDVNKTYVKVKAAAAGTTVITLQVGEVVKTNTLKFVAPTLTTIKVADNKITDVVAQDTADKAKFTKFTMLDQDGKEIAGATAPTVTVKKADGTVVESTSDLVSFVAVKEVKGKLVVNEDVNAKTDHLQVLPGNIDKGTYTVTLSSVVEEEGKEDRTVSASFQVVVGEKRAAKTITLSPKATTVTVDGTTELVINSKDQYGQFIEADAIKVAGDEYVTADETAVIALNKDGNKAEGTDEVVAYKVVVTGTKAGQGTIKVSIVDGETTLATASQSFTVASVGEVVESVEIVETKLVDSKKVASETATTADVTLEAFGKDKLENKVAINAADLTWSVKSVKDAKGEALKVNTDGTLTNAKGEFLLVDGTYAATGDKVVVSVTGNELTVTKNATVDVEVAVKTANQKVATSVVKFNGEGSKFVSGLAVFNAKFIGLVEDEATVAVKDLTDAGLKLSFKPEQVTAGTIGDIVLTFTGVDQFGNAMETETAGTVEVSATTSNRGAVKVKSAGSTSTLTLEAVAEGTATIYVTVGETTLPIEVTVSKEVIDAVKATETTEAPVAPTEGSPEAPAEEPTV